MDLVIEEIKKGNHEAFKRFFDQNYAEMVSYAQGYLFDLAASEDIVQDIFVYIWENAQKIQIETSLKSYIFRMVKNKCLNYLKSIKIKDSFNVMEFSMDLISSYDFEASSEEDKTIIYHQILKIIDTLPDKMQQIVRLKFIDNLKYKEIADKLGISVNTVKTQLQRAKSRISELIISLLILLQIS